ncbi:hypothetical protein BVY04_00970, partial [bacterium M21]
AVTGIVDVGDLLGLPLYSEEFAPRIVGTENNPNGFAVLFIVGLPISAHYFFKSTRRRKVFHLMVFAMFGLLVFLTSSRAAVLAGLLACSFYLFFNLKSHFVRFLILGTLPLALLLALAIPAYVQTLSEESNQVIINDKEKAKEIRINTVFVVADILKENLLLGTGYGNLRDEFAERDFVELGNAHNIFMGIAVEFGMFALFFFSVIMVKTMKNIKFTLRHCGRSDERRVVALGGAVFLGFLVNSMFHEGYVNILFWLTMIFIISAVRIIKFRREAPVSDSSTDQSPILPSMVIP